MAAQPTPRRQHVAGGSLGCCLRNFIWDIEWHIWDTDGMFIGLASLAILMVINGILGYLMVSINMYSKI